MPSRYDLVLGALPALAVSGMIIEGAARLLESSVGVRTGVLELPLVLIGLIAALSLVCHEVFVDPPVENH